MAGALLFELLVGVSVGLVGRLLMPGRHGLVHVMWRDPRLAPRLWTHDTETRWEVGAGILGGVGGYVVGRLFDAQAALGATPVRWILCVVGAFVLVGISVASGVIERSRYTRR